MPHHKSLQYLMIVQIFLVIDTQRIVADMSFKTDIKSVRIRQNKIIVALYNKVFVLDLFSMEI